VKNLGPFSPDQTYGKPLYILRPVSPIFITVSLAGAFLLNIMPWGSWVGVPDWVALVLVFWNTHYPRRVGIGVAFAIGLLTDVHEAALLGEHALAYTLLSFGAIALHRRTQWYSLPGQMAHVLPLLSLAQLVSMLVRMVAGARYPGIEHFLDSLSGALLWPVASWLLFAPQRRPTDRDENRPL
jgi:rod shape-determining protein MreD